MNWLLAILSVLALDAAVFWLLLRRRNIHIWFLPWLRRQLFGPFARPRVLHVVLADHWEPYYQQVAKAHAHERVRRWIEGYEQLAPKHRDGRGRHPVHSYFYPVEEYDEEILDRLAEHCRRGFGDVEIHLHHDNDTHDHTRDTLANFARLLHRRHGLLRQRDGRPVYGFIHGNWALDNSRPDGRWCGVDDEIDALLQSGCVYDMTLPSAPSDTQTRRINSIYWTREDGRPRSHEHGRDARVGASGSSDELLMIQGPLGLNLRNRKAGIMPRVDGGEISADAPPDETRVALWVDAGVHVIGAPEHVFVKLYTHGLQEKNLEAFFDQGVLDRLYTSLEEYCARHGIDLRYETAWEMYQAILSLIEGREPERRVYS